VDGFVAAAARHDDPHAAVAAVRALRRRELFRIGSADVLGLLPIDEVGRALTDVTEATLAGALSVAHREDGMDFAIIGMGRLGSAEMSYPSDADVLFVVEGGTDAAALAVAEQLRTLLAAPGARPAARRRRRPAA
jgi:glutamate-ammonia-ligase adenylyltransferase